MHSGLISILAYQLTKMNMKFMSNEQISQAVLPQLLPSKSFALLRELITSHFVPLGNAKTRDRQLHNQSFPHQPEALVSPVSGRASSSVWKAGFVASENG